MKSLLHVLNGYETKRKRLLKKVPTGPLKDYLSVPFPKPSQLIESQKIIALDFETTGLDAQQDRLLSVGFVNLQNNHIKLSTTHHQIIRSEDELKADNVIIHQITDDAKDAGDALAEVIPTLLERLAGNVMLAHFRRIESQFLNAACEVLYGYPCVCPIIDTLEIEKSRLDMRDVAYDPSELRLSNLRTKYGLPNHKAHNALTDAIATAELFLAQQAHYKFHHLKQVLP